MLLGRLAVLDAFRTDELNRPLIADAVGIAVERSNFESASIRRISAPAFPWAESGTERRPGDARASMQTSSSESQLRMGEWFAALAYRRSLKETMRYSFTLYKFVH